MHSAIEIDWRRVVLPPFPHQKDGVKAVLKSPNTALFFDVGAGKTKTVIDAAHFAYGAGRVQTLLVLAPAPARSVWVDPDPVLGEVAKHAWRDVPNHVLEWHSSTKAPALKGGALNWVVSNYEFIRNPARLKQLKAFLRGRPFWLVGDESWMIAGHKSMQNDAFSELAGVADKRVIMNGTPGGPVEVFAQLHAMDPAILGYRNFWQFRANHCVMGGWKNKAIVKWKDLDAFNEKTARVVLRVETRDAVQLPPRERPVLIQARLTPETWDSYSEMKRDLVAWFGTGQAAVAKNAGVKAVRLCQIAAGFLGGMQVFSEDSYEELDVFAGDDLPEGLVSSTDFQGKPTVLRELGREKLDATVDFLKRWWKECRGPRKAIVAARFRPEIERAARVFQEEFPDAKVVVIYGQQDEAEREYAKRLFAPDGLPDDAIMVVQPAAGGAGLNFSAANLLIRMTPIVRLKDYLQLDGRIERPGQTRSMTFVDVVAVGPNGQKTADHIIVAGLRRNEDVSKMTAAKWKRALEAQ